MKTSEYHRRYGVIERKYRKAMERLEDKGVISNLSFKVSEKSMRSKIFIQTFFTYRGMALRQDWEYDLGDGYYVPKVGYLRGMLELQTKDYLHDQAKAR